MILILWIEVNNNFRINNNTTNRDVVGFSKRGLFPPEYAADKIPTHDMFPIWQMRHHQPLEPSKYYKPKINKLFLTFLIEILLFSAILKTDSIKKIFCLI